MESQEEKMFAIATAFHDLNKKGKVKKFSANERGYALIHRVANGCRVDARRELDDRLVIRLSITETAKDKHGRRWKMATEVFKVFFNVSGNPRKLPADKLNRVKIAYVLDVSKEGRKSIIRRLHALDKKLHEGLTKVS